MYKDNPEKRYPDALISEHVQLINSSTSKRAMEVFNSGIRTKLINIILKPKLVFLKSIFVEGKIFGGIRGIIVSVLNAYEEFLIQLKLWEIQNTGKRYEK